jgi:hypothetical protein
MQLLKRHERQLFSLIYLLNDVLNVIYRENAIYYDVYEI